MSSPSLENNLKIEFVSQSKYNQLDYFIIYIDKTILIFLLEMLIKIQNYKMLSQIILLKFDPGTLI